MGPRGRLERLRCLRCEAWPVPVVTPLAGLKMLD